ncbi:MAG: hypothetical protein ACI81L_001025 [Verrucomicrobiales bacterium]|jgi:hypothetical protein
MDVWLNEYMTTTATRNASPSLASMAAEAKADRNRAIDFYRVVAMLTVAFGHWLALVAVSDAEGELLGGNALEFVPSLGWATWLLQVMPLFFVVGGFSSAMSLDSHDRNGGRAQDWIAARLRRMLPPAVVLAGTWLVVLVVAAAFGQLSLAGTPLHAGAIPLWFLANYTIDTALAPFVLPRFRANPKRFALVISGTFLVFEAMRVANVPVLPQINWVLGWLMFQVMGMAWRDGLLPTGRRLIGYAAGLWTATLGLVLSGGPWIVSMVNIPGVDNSPTNPPNLSLMTFGAAFSLTAIAAAPRISSALASRPKAWAAVVGANTVAMSVYLWHMTAAVIATGAMQFTVGLPSHVVGSLDWWMFKIPTIAASLAILAPIVFLVSRVERRALLAPRRPWNGGLASIFAVAILTSTALKLWSGGHIETAAPSLVILVICGMTALRPTPVA